ncbi:hypothetical protein AVEN_258315-1 [Araneus ventricosus]|uniref:PH domain-containing protein n=1 Tax=Araneus ventricosus TaxID=182803 RepID=A0A4Y2HN03_ARAVE|nr:hypothetical protein AVEN_258315-1 [Araneus ventricosus]
MSGDEIDTTEVLVKLFQKSPKAHALTQAYHRYTLNYINALNYLETLRRQVEFNEFEKKSSITENWASTCNKSTPPHEAGYKYIVYKQPLSLDRFFIHDVSAQDGAANNLKNAFVLVCLNRFQQIVTVHTFQASSESAKALWLSKLRDTMDRWKRTLQNTVFRNQRTSTNTATTTVQAPNSITTVK